MRGLLLLRSIRALFNIIDDELAVKTAIFDKDLVGASSRYENSRQIEAGNVAFKSFRVAYRTVTLWIDLDPRHAQQINVRMIAGEREHEIVLQLHMFATPCADADRIPGDLGYLRLKERVNGFFLDSVFDVRPDPILDVLVKLGSAVDQRYFSAVAVQIERRNGCRIRTSDYGHLSPVKGVTFRGVVRDLRQILPQYSQKVGAVVVACCNNHFARSVSPPAF